MGERKFGEALAMAPRLLAFASNRLGTAHSDVAVLLNNAGTAYQGAGLYEAAAEMLAKAVEIHERFLPPSDPRYVRVLMNYAQVLRKAHRKSEARTVRKSQRSRGRHSLPSATRILCA